VWAADIIRVLYAPHKVFKRVVEKPRILGPVLIMILFIVATVCSHFAWGSKIYFGKTIPYNMDQYNPDPWTDNSSMWASNANVSQNTLDGLYGYNSVQFNTANDTVIWAELNNIGPINFTELDDYKNLTFALKWLHAMTAPPEIARIYLFSESSDSYFYRELSEISSPSENDTWHNFTIPIGTHSAGWINATSQTTWGVISGIKFNLTWAESARSDLTVLVDRVFFESEQFESLITSSYGNIANLLLDALIGFSFTWMIIGLALFLAGRIAGVKSSLMIFLIISGYAFITFVMMKIFFAVLYSSIAPVYIPFDATVTDPTLQTILQISSYSVLLFPIWSIVLCSIGTRTFFNLTSSKSILLAVVGFSPYYVFLFLFPSFLAPFVI